VVILFSFIAVFGSASSCSLLPGDLFSNNEDDNQIYGVLKKIPDRDGFVKANATTAKSGQEDNVNTEGLSKQSITKIKAIDSDNLYLLSYTNGLYHSSSGGRTWNRKIVFNISKDIQDEEEKQLKIKEALAKNKSFKYRDMGINPEDKSVIYMAGSLSNIGKIYKSTDGGETFQMIYTEANTNSDVRFILVQPTNTNIIYAVLENRVLIKSIDGGNNWKRIVQFRDTVVDIDFSVENGNLLYVLLKKHGLATSTDEGNSWKVRSFGKFDIRRGQSLASTNSEPLFSSATYDQSSQGIVGDSKPKSSNRFTRYTKIYPVTSGLIVDDEGKIQQEPWIIVSNKTLWVTDDINTQPFQQVFLPVEESSYNLLDVAFDPKIGMDRLIVSVDDKLYESLDGGVTWNTSDRIKLDDNVGNISNILIDKQNTEIIYVTLVKNNLKMKNGIYR
jgi:photosystem II stability/assembly factor-like uncharacterized protein